MKKGLHSPRVFIRRSRDFLNWEASVTVFFLLESLWEASCTSSLNRAAKNWGLLEEYIGDYLVNAHCTALHCTALHWQ
jgi:hypothetical protein